MKYIQDLPTEVLQKVFSYLTVKDKFRCEMVCRRWQQNVFSSVKILAFEGYDDVFHGFHEHVVSKENELPLKVCAQEDSMRAILSKCGGTVQCFKGYVTSSLMQIIYQYCSALHCVDMCFDEFKTLLMLRETYAAQLTCVTLRVNMKCDTASFISKCSCLASLALISPYGGIYSPYVVNLADTTNEYPEYQQSFHTLRNLVIEGNVNQNTLEQLKMFTELETVSVTLSQEVESDDWASVMARWSNIKALCLDFAEKINVDFDILAPNLEYLSLRKTGVKHSFYNISQRIDLLTYLPKLKTLDISQRLMSPAALKAYLRAFYNSTELEKLTVSFNVGICGNSDKLLVPLLWFPSLKHLSLGKFVISSLFASHLMDKLKHLSSFGTCMTPGFKHQDYLVPGGELFWSSVKEKAISKPDEEFTFIGKLKEDLHLCEAFPPNVKITLVDCATIKLLNDFGKSSQWQDLTKRWSKLTSLNLEIVGSRFSLNGLPQSLKKLSIKCIYERNVLNTDPLTFRTLLPKLRELRISQQTMSNPQLLATLECIATYCPVLQTLCIDRENVCESFVDSYVSPLFQCDSLEVLCLGETVLVTDECGALLVSKLDALRQFGCSQEHQLGIVCGPKCLNALANKILNKIQNIPEPSFSVTTENERKRKWKR